MHRYIHGRGEAYIPERLVPHTWFWKVQEQIYIQWEVSYVEDRGKLLHYEHVSFCHAPARLSTTWQTGTEE